MRAEGILYGVRPLIGIPLCLDDRGRWRAGRSYQYLDAAYARAVGEAGGLAVHLPLQADPAAVLERVDGLLLPGGDDFAPDRPYPGVRFDPAPRTQIEFDAALLGAALARDLPVLAICYGMQLLALHHGGSLWYDIPSDVPEADAHRLGDDGRHGLEVEAGTRLADAIGTEPGPVNSLHHQGIAHPGAALRVAARAPDRIVEAVESPDRRFCIGVQWHPEKLDGPHRQRLFRAFVDACGRKHR